MTDEYEIYESKMNPKHKDDFEILESMATFHNQSFLEQIKHEMKFYELSIDALSKSCNISNFRLTALVNGNAEFEMHEVQTIKKRLHLK